MYSTQSLPAFSVSDPKINYRREGNVKTTKVLKIEELIYFPRADGVIFTGRERENEKYKCVENRGNNNVSEFGQAKCTTINTTTAVAI